MAKISGTIGYGITRETTPGVYEEKIVERNVYFNVERNMSKNVSGNKVNDDISLNNVYSFIADAYATKNFMCIKYAKIHGIAWRVTSIDVNHPRLTITLGGVYE